MTPLVDVLIVLVFFLLKNFSTDGDLMTPSPGLELPQSTAQAKPEKTLTLAISQRHILAEGLPLALVAEEIAREEATIPALAQWLEKRKRTTEEIARFNAGVEFDGKLTIQGDRKIPFRILHKVLNTCGEHGFAKFSLAVTRKDGG
jgi:biopolymer transport protein ExbD